MGLFRADGPFLYFRGGAVRFLFALLAVCIVFVFVWALAFLEINS